ncbi:hypothetical protein ACODT3_42695 [Streptomyces sp. 4.24]|uniref:hypothetical protein n=1 Tax=Streptomyces tritrimontium TaxID=3406573 RepID=UPI003BB6A193
MQTTDPLIQARDLLHEHLNSDALSWPEDHADNDTRITELITEVQTDTPKALASARSTFFELKDSVWHWDSEYQDAIKTWDTFVALVQSATRTS